MWEGKNVKVQLSCEGIGGIGEDRCVIFRHQIVWTEVIIKEDYM